MRWQWHHLDHMLVTCSMLKTDNHSNTSSLKFFTGQMLFLSPKQQHQSTKAPKYHMNFHCFIWIRYIPDGQLSNTCCVMSATVSVFVNRNSAVLLDTMISFKLIYNSRADNNSKPAIQWVREHSLTFCTRRVCCHSNETQAPTAKLSNSVQLEGTPYYSSKLHLGLCSSVGIWRQTDTDRHTCPWPIYISLGYA